MPRDLSDDDFDLPLGTTRKRPPTSTSPNPRSSHKRLSKGNTGSGSSPTGTRGEGVLPVTPAASPRFEESRRISASKHEGVRRKVVATNSTRGGVSSEAGRDGREGESRRRGDERFEEEGPIASTSAVTALTPARRSVTNSTRRSSGKEFGRKDESGKKQRRNSSVVVDDVDESDLNEEEEERDRKPRINRTTRSSPLPTEMRKSPTKSPKKRVLPPSPSTSHDPSPPVTITLPLPLPPPVTPIDTPSLPSVQSFLSALPLPLSHLYPTFESMGCITGVDLLALADDSEVGKGSRKLLLDLVGEENQEGMSRWQRVMLEEGLKSVKKRWFQ